MLGVVTPVPYVVAVLLALVTGVVLCVCARRNPGPWTVVAGRLIALVLVSDATSFLIVKALAGTWSPKTDLPFSLCNAAVLVAAAACWWHKAILVEITYFGVVGLKITPRPGSVTRIFAITIGYTGFVAVIDAIFGADYMFLRQPPRNWTLLSVLGPWPWYILSAAGVALVLVAALDLPFLVSRHRHG